MANTVFDASSVNRNFDDLYNEFNGSINSANIDPSFTLAASAVTITDTASNYTSTEVETVLAEIKGSISSTIPKVARGFNSLHVLTQRSNGIIIYPGKVEVNDNVYTVAGKTTITSPTLISGSFSVQALYGLAVHITASTTVITASDFWLIPYADTSATSGMDEDKNGYYFSSNYRVLHVLANLHSASDTMRLYHHQTLGALDKPFRVQLTGSEAGMHGFNSAGGTTIQGQSTAKIIIKHNSENETYDYSIMGSQTGALNLQLPPFFGFNPDAFNAMGYFIKSSQWFLTGGNYYTSPPSVSSTGSFLNTIFLAPENTNFYNGPKIVIFGTQAGPYYVELTKTPQLGFKPS